MSLVAWGRQDPGNVVSRIPTYAKIAALTAAMAFTYRFNAAMGLLGVLLQIFLLKIVWTAVYADRPAVEGVDLATLLTYLTIANLQIWILLPDTSWLLQQKVREGKIAQDLARPVGLLEQIVSQGAGFTAGFLPFVIAATPVAVVVGVLRPPPSFEAGAFYAVSLLLAYVVVTWLGLLIGLIAFWTLETTGIHAIYRFANLFFAGGLVPLWLFPEPLRTISALLPFQTQAHIPVSIYVGRMSGSDALGGLAVQALWAVLLGLLAVFVWSKALRKVVIQGG